MSDMQFKAGDPPPAQGYEAYEAWMRAQHAAGYRQQQCAKCWLWTYPQEGCGCPDEKAEAKPEEAT